MLDDIIPGNFQLRTSIAPFAKVGLVITSISIEFREQDQLNHLQYYLVHSRYSKSARYATVRTGHGTTDWFQIGKGVRQGCILSPHLFNLYAALTYSFSYLEPVCCSMSSSNCCFLTCIHISQEAGQVVCSTVY